jgi:hypothetical protein
MAITCPIRKEEPKAVLTTVRRRKSDPPPGPVTRPTYVVGPVEVEAEINRVMRKVAAAYDLYQSALQELRAMSGPKSDPFIDRQQIRFAFADQYVTARINLVQPNPAMHGPWSSALKPTDLKMTAKPRVIPRYTAPECRACLMKLSQPVRLRPVNAKSPDKRMEEVIQEIYDTAQRSA